VRNIAGVEHLLSAVCTDISGQHRLLISGTAHGDYVFSFGKGGKSAATESVSLTKPEFQMIIDSVLRRDKDIAPGCSPQSIDAVRSILHYGNEVVGQPYTVRMRWLHAETNAHFHSLLEHQDLCIAKPAADWNYIPDTARFRSTAPNGFWSQAIDDTRKRPDMVCGTVRPIVQNAPDYTTILAVLAYRFSYQPATLEE
jgi:hypothetical protein